MLNVNGPNVIRKDKKSRSHIEIENNVALTNTEKAFKHVDFDLKNVTKNTYILCLQ